MKQLLSMAFLLVICNGLGAQDTLYVKDSVIYESHTVFIAADPKVKRPSPYRTSLKKDGPIIIGLLGLNALGLHFIKEKKELTPDQLATRTRDRVPFFDRGNVGYYNERIDKDSYIPFYASFAWPVVMMFVDGDQTRHLGQVLTLYIETMAVTGAMFSMTAGLIHRSRPLVYGENTPMPRRISKNSQRSFYAGHTAATAASSFFAAKVFSDMNPDSRLKPVVWVIAAALPAVVGYQRYQSGQHFLSDNIIGYGLGAATGYLIPHWHKVKKNDNLSIVPAFGIDFRGVAVTYKF